MIRSHTDLSEYDNGDRQTKGYDSESTAVKTTGTNIESFGLTKHNEMPMDEHPFVHRLAEMLPTGVAVLDHNAQAVFVNQRFHQLTTH
jgi:PAS domain-containing protein